MQSRQYAINQPDIGDIWIDMGMILCYTHDCGNIGFAGCYPQEMTG